MDIREMIEIAAERSGGQAALAERIGVTSDYLARAISGRRGLPSFACGKLGEILAMDSWAVSVASSSACEIMPEAERPPRLLCYRDCNNCETRVCEIHKK